MYYYNFKNLKTILKYLRLYIQKKHVLKLYKNNNFYKIFSKIRNINYKDFKIL